MPDDTVSEVDHRNSKPNRSAYVHEAVLVRFLLEDREEFTELLEDATTAENPA